MLEAILLATAEDDMPKPKELTYKQAILARLWLDPVSPPIKPRFSLKDAGRSKPRWWWSREKKDAWLELAWNVEMLAKELEASMVDLENDTARAYARLFVSSGSLAALSAARMITAREGIILLEAA